MNIDQLRYFVTVAQLENLSKAAEVLYMNQPTLSKNISRLEQELGTELFDRNGKRLLLNKQGERFLEYASAILREMEVAQAELKQLDCGENAGIRIGAAGCAGKVLSCAMAFHAAYPECVFTFDFCMEEQEMPDMNEYDVLICPDGIRYEKFDGYLFGTEDCCLAVAASHPLAGATAVSVRQLAGLDYVFYRKGKFYTEYAHRVMTALKIPMQVVCFTDSRQSQIEIIRSGMAAGLLPEGLFADTRPAGIRLIPLTGRQFSRRMKICFKREKYLSVPAQAFKSFTLDRFGLCGEDSDEHV